MVTGVQPQLPDILSGLVVKVVDNRFQPGIVRVPRIIDVAAVHLKPTETYMNHCSIAIFLREPGLAVVDPTKVNSV